MGKGEKSLQQQQQHHHHQDQSHQTHDGSGFICPECSRFFNRITQEFSFRCVFVSILSFSVFLTEIFWILPRHSINSATVQAYFRLKSRFESACPTHRTIRIHYQWGNRCPRYKVMASTFGQPYMFEILKCPGGITMIPGQAASIWQSPNEAWQNYAARAALK